MEKSDRYDHFLSGCVCIAVVFFCVWLLTMYLTPNKSEEDLQRE